METKKKTTKKKVAVKKKATKKLKKPILSPQEFQETVRGINKVIPRAHTVLDSMKPNQQGIAVVFILEDGKIKDGVFALDVDSKDDGIGCILHIIKLCGFNPVEILHKLAQNQ